MPRVSLSRYQFKMDLIMMPLQLILITIGYPRNIAYNYHQVFNWVKWIIQLLALIMFMAKAQASKYKATIKINQSTDQSINISSIKPIKSSIWAYLNQPSHESAHCRPWTVLPFVNGSHPAITFGQRLAIELIVDFLQVSWSMAAPKTCWVIAAVKEALAALEAAGGVRLWLVEP